MNKFGFYAVKYFWLFRVGVPSAKPKVQSEATVTFGEAKGTDKRAKSQKIYQRPKAWWDYRQVVERSETPAMMDAIIKTLKGWQISAVPSALINGIRFRRGFASLHPCLCSNALSVLWVNRYIIAISLPYFSEEIHSIRFLWNRQCHEHGILKVWLSITNSSLISTQLVEY